MPVTAPENKLNNVKRLGAKVTLYGENLAHALVKASKMSKQNKYTFVFIDKTYFFSILK